MAQHCLSELSSYKSYTRLAILSSPRYQQLNPTLEGVGVGWKAVASIFIFILQGKSWLISLNRNVPICILVIAEQGIVK